MFQLIDLRTGHDHQEALRREACLRRLASAFKAIESRPDWAHRLRFRLSPAA
jgi:hypothetical protein